MCHLLLQSSNLQLYFTHGMERTLVTYVDTSDISAAMFITVLLFLIIIAPLVSLGILKLFQGKKKQALWYVLSGVAVYFIFQWFMWFVF